jgi:hypothetical protein
MPADVIINPTSGEIYWNDSAGSPQSISLRGDAQNKIDIIGYGASFSPGGGGIGTFVIATFNDSVVPGTSAFVPGTSGNDIGSATLRWKTFLTSTNISDSSASLGTNSTSLLSGLVQVNGGIAISGNASIGQSLNFYNTAATFFTGFKADAVTSNTLYTLPSAYPSGVGSSYLSASTTGIMAWVAAPTGGGGSPGGSNKQIQYNNSSAFGGASGFEYTTGGIALTVSIFSSSGTGYTSGVWISAIGATTRVGIGLSNPQYELEILGEISATNKSFVINHPTKSGMKLRYGSLEGPENGVYVRGELNNSNIIEVPDHWLGLVHEDSYTVHLTPIGRYAQLYVEKIQNYNVYVADNNMNSINCYYSVWAERKDIPKLITEY